MVCIGVEFVQKFLDDMKKLVVSGNCSDVDFIKIQIDIMVKQEQIVVIVVGMQVNGVNLFSINGVNVGMIYLVLGLLDCVGVIVIVLMIEVELFDFEVDIVGVIMMVIIDIDFVVIVVGEIEVLLIIVINGVVMLGLVGQCIMDQVDFVLKFGDLLKFVVSLLVDVDMEESLVCLQVLQM